MSWSSWTWPEDGELRSTGTIRSIYAALRELGDAAVARARDWTVGGDAELHRLAVGVLARSGERSDAPVLVDALAAAVAGEDWCGLEDVAVGLGRLAVDEAAGLLIRAWESTPHSYARIALFQGLAGCLPAGFDDFAVEGLDDCEESVQEAACSAAPPTPFVIERLRALRTAPERGDRQACAAIRLDKILGQGL